MFEWRATGWSGSERMHLECNSILMFGPFQCISNRSEWTKEWERDRKRASEQSRWLFFIRLCCYSWIPFCLLILRKKNSCNDRRIRRRKRRKKTHTKYTHCSATSEIEWKERRGTLDIVVLTALVLYSPHSQRSAMLRSMLMMMMVVEVTTTVTQCPRHEMHTHTHTHHRPAYTIQMQCAPVQTA